MSEAPHDANSGPTRKPDRLSSEQIACNRKLFRRLGLDHDRHDMQRRAAAIQRGLRLLDKMVKDGASVPRPSRIVGP